MGPPVLHDEAPDWIPFEAPVKPALLEGLGHTLLGTSLTGFAALRTVFEVWVRRAA